MNTTFSRTLLATSTLFISSATMAAGFQVNEHSATGLGRAFAGEAVIADNASVLSRNAAAMMMFDKDAISVGMTVVKPDVTVRNGTYNRPNGTLNVKYNPLTGNKSFDSAGVGYDSIDVADVDGIAPTAVVPNFYYIHPINEKFAVGVAAYSNFGTGTEFESDYQAPIFGGTTKVQSMNLGLSLAYRVNEHLSFGGGIDVIYGMGDLYRDADGDVTVNVDISGIPDSKDPSLTINGKTTAVDIQATGVGLGANIGMVYEVNEGNRFGLSYKYSPEIEAEGDVSFMKQSYDAVYLPLPDIAEFSGFHMITDKTAIHYSIQWVGWSAFDTIETESATVKEYNWKDSYHYSIGATHYLNNKWILRTGYMYDQSPVNELTSISIPDSDRQWFSAGFTYNWSSNTAIDFGFTYLIGKDVEVHEFVEESLPAPAVTATTHADAILAAIQLSHSF
ncbi:aromatic hydrocarbon degradation protein [Aliivibrio fischeri]|uniref:outer membrane protein transport protein n=1 Tax=Aliivibrio fischeri TaxID=668 RepID=UPI0012D9357F|nr:outer membrane protein transport protein [Aliivibrio fischeri]MUK63198.1 aromatic hydrocarbon degradation protein [Aliivibrio fischeri]MUL20185.1 aromatic hydrocarbon degradation protein [Aliivibrio fischeri]MUL23960.1 aromatic hydrocarbon degradation protein [Aliivibrio fischeri]